MEEGEKRKWEWMGHNESNTRRLNEAGPARRRRSSAHLRHIGSTQASGRKAGSARSSGDWDTLDHLIDNAANMSPMVQRRQPYQMTLDDGRTIVAMPYTQQLNDKSTIERRLVSAEGFAKISATSSTCL